MLRARVHGAPRAARAASAGTHSSACTPTLGARPPALSAAGAAAAFEGSLDWLGLDLVAAIRRQQGFMRDMLAARAAYDSDN